MKFSCSDLDGRRQASRGAAASACVTWPPTLTSRPSPARASPSLWLGKAHQVGLAGSGRRILVKREQAIPIMLRPGLDDTPRSNDHGGIFGGTDRLPNPGRAQAQGG